MKARFHNKVLRWKPKVGKSPDEGGRDGDDGDTAVHGAWQWRSALPGLSMEAQAKEAGIATTVTGRSRAADTSAMMALAMTRSLLHSKKKARAASLKPRTLDAETARQQFCYCF